MRLPNGYGSVVKLAGKRRKPYGARITVYWTDDGKQVFKYLGYYKKRQEALEALQIYNKSPYDLETHKLTFADIYQKWAQERYKDDPVPNTYTSAFKHASALNDMQFTNIRAYHIQDVIDTCKLGYSTKKNIRILISQLYKFCIIHEICNTDYAKLTKLPPAVESRVHKPFTRNEIDLLWQHIDDIGARFALVYIYTGMRPTELLKIKIKDVHLNESYMMGGMKTAAGINRAIPIHNRISPFIKDWYNDSNEYLVMNSSDGKPMLNYDRLRMYVWQRSPILRAMDHKPHDGRHTCATLLDDAGVNKKVIQLILGHKSRDITHRVYTHKTLTQLIDGINCIL